MFVESSDSTRPADVCVCVSESRLWPVATYVMVSTPFFSHSNQNTAQNKP